MSIHLTKQIGWFLSNEAAHAVLVEDARRRVEETAEDSTLFDGLLDFVDEAISDRPGLTDIERAMLPLRAAKLVSLYDSGAIEPWKLVKNVINYDNHEGFLFCDEESECRQNNAIDLFEQGSNPEDWCFKVQALDAPANSWGGYRPVGTTSPELAKHLEEGVRLPRGMATQMIRMLESVAHPPEIRRQRAVEAFNRYFRPEVDPLCSILAEKLGLIKDGVSSQEFEDMLLPSILTTWS